MRKILSKSEQEKKRKRNSIIIGVILMIVMFGSVFGIVVGSFGQNSSGKNKMPTPGLSPAFLIFAQAKKAVLNRETLAGTGSQGLHS